MREGAGFYSQRIATLPRRKPWDFEGWERGENSFAEDNEIRNNEFYEGQNIEIVGKASIRMPRRGATLFATVAGGVNFNGWGIYKNPVTSTNLLIVMVDGHVYKINTSGTVTEIDGTKTWDASAKMRGILLRDWFYFGNAVDYLAKTDGSTIVEWTAVTTPAGLSIALTGAGSDAAYEYGVTAVTDTGETEISATDSDMGPSTLDATHYFTLTWTRKTDSNMRGYNVYRAKDDGTMTLLTFVAQQSSGATMTYVDNGAEEQSLIHEAPTFNTTGGVKANLYGSYANTLFMSGNDTEVDTVFYGGTGTNWESLAPSDNGGWVKPGRGDGEKITAMIGFSDFLLIFKENSIWKFTFGSDGGPLLTAVIPQYGTRSPDTVWRMEKDIAFFGSDGRFRILGWEPTQLNVIRTSDISNRIQPKLDALDKTDLDAFHAIFYEQKFIVCDKTVAFPYDRRYLGFLGKWTNYLYDRFIVWDAGTGQNKLYGAQVGTGEIHQLLVDNTYDDVGDTIPATFRVKRIDGGEDMLLKYFYDLKVKLKNPRGNMSLYLYKDGSTLVNTRSVTFDTGGGIGEYMFDEAMFDESIAIDSVPDAIFLLKKLLEFEAYSIYPQIEVTGNEFNHCLVQTMAGTFEVEDYDYERDETIID